MLVSKASWSGVTGLCSPESMPPPPIGADVEVRGISVPFKSDLAVGTTVVASSELLSELLELEAEPSTLASV